MNSLRKLVSRYTGGSFIISTEFGILVREWSGVQVLGLIKTGWPQHSTWIEVALRDDQIEAWEKSTGDLISHLKNLQLKCRDEREKPLRETTLSLNALLGRMDRC